MLCALINKLKEHISKPRDIHSICSGVNFPPKDGFQWLLFVTAKTKSSAITVT